MSDPVCWFVQRFVRLGVVVGVSPIGCADVCVCIWSIGVGGQPAAFAHSSNPSTHTSTNTHPNTHIPSVHPIHPHTHTQIHPNTHTHTQIPTRGRGDRLDVRARGRGERVVVVAPAPAVVVARAPALAHEFLRDLLLLQVVCFSSGGWVDGGASIGRPRPPSNPQAQMHTRTHAMGPHVCSGSKITPTNKATPTHTHKPTNARTNLVDELPRLLGHRIVVLQLLHRLDQVGLRHPQALAARPGAVGCVGWIVGGWGFRRWLVCGWGSHACVRGAGGMGRVDEHHGCGWWVYKHVCVGFVVRRSLPPSTAPPPPNHPLPAAAPALPSRRIDQHPPPAPPRDLAAADPSIESIHPQPTPKPPIMSPTRQEV